MVEVHNRHTPLHVLGPEDVDAIAALCRRGLSDPPSVEELRGALFHSEQAATVRGDPSVGVVASARGVEHVNGPEQGFIRLFAVDPERRGRGHGRALLTAAEDDLTTAGCMSVTTGADAPRYLWPGVDVRETALLCLLERAGYQRAETNFDMAVDLARIPPDPGGTRLARSDADDRAALAAFCDANYPNWKPEVLRALEQQTLVVADDADGIVGFCAYSVARAELLGPVAVRLELIGKRKGEPLLLGALHRMRAAGHEHVEVSWVGPIVPYARVGGEVSRVFFVYRKALRRP